MQYWKYSDLEPQCHRHLVACTYLRTCLVLVKHWQGATTSYIAQINLDFITNLSILNWEKWQHLFNYLKNRSEEMSDILNKAFSPDSCFRMSIQPSETVIAHYTEHSHRLIIHIIMFLLWMTAALSQVLKVFFFANCPKLEVDTECKLDGRMK